MKNYLFIGIILLLVALLSIKSCQVHNLNKELANPLFKTDTIIRNIPYKVEVIKEITKPVIVIQYQTDTIIRQQAEEQTIITNVQFIKHNFFNRKLDFMQVDNIDTAGLIFSSKYNTYNFKSIKIDGTGNAQVKKKKFIALKVIGIITVSATSYLFIKHQINK